MFKPISLTNKTAAETIGSGLIRGRTKPWTVKTLIPSEAPILFS